MKKKKESDKLFQSEKYKAMISTHVDMDRAKEILIKAENARQRILNMNIDDWKLNGCKFSV